MEPRVRNQLIRFLQEEIGVPDREIHVAERILARLGLHDSASFANCLPIVLWQYGLVNLEQLDRVLDWLNSVSFFT
ncbi:MAG: DUF2949 domain-containing protein [Scytolyngbya sp. HA4215-MV1]|jgi:hypothetical protein|nr:DUF2949 domain-containing protein [Scytolyngbya sp. HA4215-MV1]